jgi:hypothetical protein
MKGKAMKRWAWIAGVWLMFLLGIFSTKTSPAEDLPPEFMTTMNELAASGNSTSRSISFSNSTRTLTTLTSPAVYSSIMLGVYTPTQPEERVLDTEDQYHMVIPPMWASDEVRGIRKRFRG